MASFDYASIGVTLPSYCSLAVVRRREVSAKASFIGHARWLVSATYHRRLIADGTYVRNLLSFYIPASHTGLILANL